MGKAASTRYVHYFYEVLHMINVIINIFSFPLRAISLFCISIRHINKEIIFSYDIELSLEEQIDELFTIMNKVSND